MRDRYAGDKLGLAGHQVKRETLDSWSTGRRGASTQPVCRCRINAFQTTQNISKELGPGPHTTLRRKNPLKNRLFSETRFFTNTLCDVFYGRRSRQNPKVVVKKNRIETGFYANPLCDLFCVSRANFEISGNTEFCSFVYDFYRGKTQFAKRKK